MHWKLNNLEAALKPDAAFLMPLTAPTRQWFHPPINQSTYKPINISTDEHIKQPTYKFATSSINRMPHQLSTELAHPINTTFTFAR